MAASVGPNDTPVLVGFHEEVPNGARLRGEPVLKPLLHSTDDASRLDCVARRSHIGNMLPPRALPDGRLPGLGATRGFNTGS